MPHRTTTTIHHTTTHNDTNKPNNNNQPPNTHSKSIAQVTRGPEDSVARGSRDPVAHPVETSIAQRTAPDLVLWSDEPGGLLEPAQEERKARGKSVPIGQIQRKRPRTSLRPRLSATGAATACEPELLTIHITDNHIKSQTFRSSWRTSALCRMHLAVN